MRALTLIAVAGGFLIATAAWAKDVEIREVAVLYYYVNGAWQVLAEYDTYDRVPPFTTHELMQMCEEEPRAEPSKKPNRDAEVRRGEKA